MKNRRIKNKSKQKQRRKTEKYDQESGPQATPIQRRRLIQVHNYLQTERCCCDCESILISESALKFHCGIIVPSENGVDLDVCFDVAYFHYDIIQFAKILEEFQFCHLGRVPFYEKETDAGYLFIFGCDAVRMHAEDVIMTNKLPCKEQTKNGKGKES